MNRIATILVDQAPGSMRVEVDDNWSHVVAVTEPEMRENALHVEATDAEADNVHYRIEESVHDPDDDLVLERRHTRDDDWDAVGPVTHVERAE